MTNDSNYKVPLSWPERNGKLIKFASVLFMIGTDDVNLLRKDMYNVRK
jgi:hypothetical protein